MIESKLLGLAGNVQDWGQVRSDGIVADVVASVEQQPELENARGHSQAPMSAMASSTVMTLAKIGNTCSMKTLCTSGFPEVQTSRRMIRL